MKTIKTNNVELLLVKVPRDASEFSIVSNMLYTSLGFPFKDKIIHLPSIGYQIKNTLSKLTEEQAKELVDQCPYFAKCWKKYNITELEELPNEPFSLEISCWTALESFHSLMAVNEVYLEESEYLILIKK